MAPSSGHLLVSKALKAIHLAASKTTSFVRSKLPEKVQANASLRPIPVYARNHPVHPLAYLKQVRSQKNRAFSTQIRTFISSTTKPRSRASPSSRFPTSRIGATIRQVGASPFASTLRPNLTGGTLPRTAGGYSLGGAGKVRFFGHTAACQAQVVHNVNAGVRAFFVGGGKVCYDGIDPKTGEKRFRAVSTTEDKVLSKFERSSTSFKGTSVEFRISPTVTALCPTFAGQESKAVDTLQSPNLLSTLSGDFARSLRSLSLILADLERLSQFGDLPVSLNADGTTITVRFPGCDADLVTSLCDEVGVTRGTVIEDAAWNDEKEVQMALLFPFAPTADEDADSILSAQAHFSPHNKPEAEAQQQYIDWRDMMSPFIRSLRSKQDDEQSLDELTLRSFMLGSRSPSGYGSLEDSEGWSPPAPKEDLVSNRVPSASQDFEGVEGVYRFLQFCDESRR